MKTGCILTLKKVQLRFEYWRKKRKPGERIPDRLWRAATEVARLDGIGKAAQALKLNYTLLKKRSGLVERQREEFIEVPLPLAVPRSDCVIEITGSSGARMRVALNGQLAQTAEAVVQVLWSRA
jgi:hypothetical protein